MDNKFCELRYASSSQIIDHLVYPEYEEAVVDYILSSYGEKPEVFEFREVAILDLGEPIFAGTSPHTVEVEGYKFQLYAQHKFSIADNLNYSRIRNKRNFGEELSLAVKVYQPFAHIVMPERFVEKLIYDITALHNDWIK